MSTVNPQNAPFDPLTQIKFKYWICQLKFGKYPNGRIALRLVGAAGFESEGEAIATCTVNLPDQELPEGFVFIKDWSENEGMLRALVSTKIVEYPVKEVPSGYVKAHMCKLLIQPY
jgi:hypothetical protein